MISQQDILFTGGSGMLGTELKKLFPESFFPIRNEFDINNYRQIFNYISNNLHIKCVVHCAGATDTQAIETAPIEAINANIIGTANLVKVCYFRKIKLIHISTDYVYKGDIGNYSEDSELLPVNKYAWSKLGSECAVQMYDNSLIIRTTFSPNVFPFKKAFIDQYTSRESVKDIAKMIKNAITSDIVGVLNVGGVRKTVYDLAIKQREKNVEVMSRKEMSIPIPRDTSMDITKYQNLIRDKKTIDSN